MSGTPRGLKNMIKVENLLCSFWQEIKSFAFSVVIRSQKLIVTSCLSVKLDEWQMFSTSVDTDFRHFSTHILQQTWYFASRMFSLILNFRRFFSRNNRVNRCPSDKIKLIHMVNWAH